MIVWFINLFIVLRSVVSQCFLLYLLMALSAGLFIVCLLLNFLGEFRVDFSMFSLFFHFEFNFYPFLFNLLLQEIGIIFSFLYGFGGIEFHLPFRFDELKLSLFLGCLSELKLVQFALVLELLHLLEHLGVVLVSFCVLEFRVL